MTVWKVIFWVLLCTLLLVILWLLAIRGRRGVKDIRYFDSFAYAHRGFHNKKKGIPENSLPAFRRSAERGYGAELDVHLLSDGGLAVFHDSDLRRMTGVEGEIEDLTTSDLKAYRLGQTEETIPTFREALDVYEERGCPAPLVVEIKSARGNYAKVSEAVCSVLDSYKGKYVIESFDPLVLIWLRFHHPEIIRGQLSTNFLKEKVELAWPLRFGATYLLANFAAKPDFIAYRFSERRNLSNRLCLKLWKIQGASWTIKNMNNFRLAREEGLWPIFEGFDPGTLPLQ